jgi:DNA primase
LASIDYQTALRQVIDYYHETLKASPEALEYLDKRGLKQPELIDAFRLGYAKRTLAYRLPSWGIRRYRVPAIDQAGGVIFYALL